MKVIVFLLFFASWFKGIVVAQTNVDSLTGVYAGIAYQKYDTGTVWTMLDDTITVQSIDSTNCMVLTYLTTCCWSQGPSVPLYTDYPAFCVSSISNNYFKFYNSDSLACIFDSIPQPWPNPSYSVRFYGKRIGPLPIGIKGNKEKEELIKVWPNPTSGVLSINTQDIKGQVKISIVNAVGEEIKKQHKELENNLYELDVSDLPEGIYLLRIETEKGIMTKKVVVE